MDTTKQCVTCCCYHWNIDEKDGECYFCKALKKDKVLIELCYSNLYKSYSLYSKSTRLSGGKDFNTVHIDILSIYISDVLDMIPIEKIQDYLSKKLDKDNN